jgi:hypothetical protein
MDDCGVAHVFYLVRAVFRLSLFKGEGRVRVAFHHDGPLCEPLTSILSPLRKERGEQNHAKHVPPIVRVAVNSI